MPIKGLVAAHVALLVAVTAALASSGAAGSPVDVRELHTVTWYGGADDNELYNVTRWKQDLRSIKMLGLDGVWIVNSATSLNADLEGKKWDETRLAKLNEMLAYARSMNMRVIICLGYCWPATATLLLDDSEFGRLINYTARVVRETSGYNNVIYVVALELLVGYPVYAEPGKHPVLLADFRRWCRKQNPDIDHWNARWKTDFTWDTMEPGQSSLLRHTDLVRWVYALMQPRIAQFGDHIKSIAPNATLGYHGFWVKKGIDVPPSESPLGLTNKYDFASNAYYGSGLEGLRTVVDLVRKQEPKLPLFFGEFGNGKDHKDIPRFFEDLPSCRAWLDSKRIGYNWWCWQEYHGQQFGFVDLEGRRTASFRVLPNASKIGTIRGKIADSADPSKALKDVKASAGGVDVCSIYNGSYRIDLKPGVYDLEVAASGYETIRLARVAAKAGEDTTVDVKLKAR